MQQGRRGTASDRPTSWGTHAVSGRTWAGPVPVYPARSVHRDTGAKRHACFALLTYLGGLSPAPTGETEAVGSVVIARSQPKQNPAGSHPHIRRQASSSRHFVGGYALFPRPSSQVSPRPR
jgi:hypothetical protein